MTVVDQDQTRRYTAPGAKKACLWLYPNPGTERLLLDVGRLVADTAVPDELHNAVKILPGVDRARRPFPSPSWARWSLSACLWCSGGC